jgi:hypothetical protein
MNGNLYKKVHFYETLFQVGWQFDFASTFFKLIYFVSLLHLLFFNLLALLNK